MVGEGYGLSVIEEVVVAEAVNQAIIVGVFRLTSNAITIEIGTEFFFPSTCDSLIGGFPARTCFDDSRGVGAPDEVLALIRGGTIKEDLITGAIFGGSDDIPALA